jgi:hypothetical protein
MRVANGNSSVGIIAPLKVYDRTIGGAKANGMGKNVDEFAEGIAHVVAADALRLIGRSIFDRKAGRFHRLQCGVNIVHLRSGLPQAALTEHVPIPCSIFWRSIKSNRLTGQPAEAISPRIAFWCLGQLRSPELVDTNDRVSDFAIWGTRSGRGPPAAPSSAVAGGPRVRILFPPAASPLRT